MSRGRVAAIVVVVGGVVFGFWGGIYSTPNWWSLKRQVRSEQAAMDTLRVAIDSLKTTAEAIEHDPAMQERVAREQFGMIRPGETLYRIVSGGVDSTGR